MKHIPQVTRNTLGPFFKSKELFHFKTPELKSQTSLFNLTKLNIDKLKIMFETYLT